MMFRPEVMVDALRSVTGNCNVQRQQELDSAIVSLIVDSVEVGNCKRCLHFFVPLTLRATLLAALRIAPLRPLPLAVFPLAGLAAVLFVLEAGILALTGLLEGAFLSAGLRGDFACA